MRIGILTQPLYNNYGGLLQNYALQVVLRRGGHDPLTIDLNYRPLSGVGKLKSLVKRFVLRTLFRKKTSIRLWNTEKEKNTIGENTSAFIRNHILTTKKIYQLKDERILKEYSFNAYIVGSDQCWRPKYSPCIQTFFLDFLKDDKCKRIAYAASFGVDVCEFSIRLQQQIAPLIKRFQALSVREFSAVALCKNCWGVKSTHVLDPTMLLLRDDYLSLIQSSSTDQVFSNSISSYILDSSENKATILGRIAHFLDREIVKLMPTPFSFENRNKIEKCVYKPISEWLRGISESECVVTDSFHGVVFSLIFNKPFWVIANKDRGLTRIESLLGVFGIEERLIDSLEDFENKKTKLIDYEQVNKIIDKERRESLFFLLSALEK